MEVRVNVNSSLALGAVLGGAIGILCCASQGGNLEHVKEYVQQLLRVQSGKKKKKRVSFAVMREEIGGAACQPDGQQELGVNMHQDSAELEGVADREMFWYNENQTEHFRLSMALKKIVLDTRSDFQRLQVVETAQFGTTLIMDGQTQSTQLDEHVYHESLVHPAMVLHEKPLSVFIGGGGEFATAREVLRHESVTKCVMVDIDKDACDLCREFLPDWNAGAYDDPRFHVEYTDAYAWLENCEEKFDVIIMDICDPIEAGPGYKLYTSEFYSFLVEKRLNPGGVFVTQSGPCSIYNAKQECFTTIHNTLASVFDVVVPYAVDVPSFGGSWGFNLAFKCPEGESSDAAKSLVYSLGIPKINTLLEERILGGTAKLKFLDGLSFRGLLGVAKEIRQLCEQENRVMTIDNPVFMFAK